MTINGLKEIIVTNAAYTKFSNMATRGNTSETVAKAIEGCKAKFLEIPELETAHRRRLYHVAYSLCLGTDYPQIECKVREGNELTDFDWRVINDIRGSVEK